MKKYILACLVVVMNLFYLPASSQTDDSTLLGLPGDNLDLYAVLDLFQKSKTIEEFEKSLNLEKTAINNLDLDLDGKVDFIKVVTTNEGNDFTFVLQVAVSKTETQDVAVILVSKDEKTKKIVMQIVGDIDLYGKDYIVELKESKAPAVTANPAYAGPDTIIVSAPAKTTVVVVESAPIVQYVYSPVYIPYYPPYYYGFYPPYFAPFSVMAVGIYIGHHSYYHHGGYGYHGNTVVIHNHNNYNHYNNSRHSSNTVNHYKANGNYNKGNTASTRPSTGATTRPSTGASTQPTGGTSKRQSGGASATQSPVKRQPAGSSGAGRQATPSSSKSNNYSSPQPRPSSNGASRYSGGGGSKGGGGSRGGGGGRRR